MKHGSLFSGIGGFDLAAQWMGWDNVFHCEIEPFPRQVLHHHFPNSISYEDIKATDFTIHRGQIDILTGGFPCQPFSTAGKRKGTEDDRHLWPEMLRAIREIKPSWVIGENVYGIVNWDGGVVFEQVQLDLEAEGYEVQPYILPAVSVNAPHRRDRIWFVAYKNDDANTNSDGCNSSNSEHEKHTSKRGEYAQCNTCEGFKDGVTTDTGNKRLQGRQETNTRGKEHNKERSGTRIRAGAGSKDISRESNWQEFPTQSPICIGNDGVSYQLDDKPLSTSKWRKESLKGLGNAIVPQVALQIFKSIEQFNKIEL